MMLDKKFFYDWAGANDVLFFLINDIRGTLYDKLMVITSQLGEHQQFAYYIYACLVWACIGYLYRRFNGYINARAYLTVWLGVLIVLAAGFAAEVAMLKTLKAEFAYARPYMIYNDIHVLDPSPLPEKDYHSFPSGHTSLITLLVVTLWPVMSPLFRWIGVLLIPLVGWSRVSMGMHFPADVFYGFLFTFVLILIIRAVMYPLLHRIGLRC